MTSYALVLTDGTFDRFVPEDGVLDNSSTPTGHGLVFTGRGVTSYGEVRNENIVHLAEHFSDATPPPEPLIGQLWWDNVGDVLNAWNGSAWIPVTADEFIVSGSYPVNDGTGIVTVTKSIAGSVQLISNAASAANLTGHISAGAGGAHAASAISFVPTGSVSANNVQDAIENVDTNIDAHVNDTSAAHAATAIEFVPYLSITSTNVQGALQDANTLRIGIDTDITTVQSGIDAHEADTVDAHDASAISFIPAGGVVSTDVQAAIDEIFAGAGTPGALETVLARPSSTQAIGTAFTQILFQTVLHGNALSQWNIVTNAYTAAFDQEVNIKFALQFVIANNREGFMEIRNGGTVLRNHRVTNFDNDAGASSVNITQNREIGVKTRLNQNDQVRFYAQINAGSGVHNTQTITTACQVEFEITRDLS